MFRSASVKSYHENRRSDRQSRYVLRRLDFPAPGSDKYPPAPFRGHTSTKTSDPRVRPPSLPSEVPHALSLYPSPSILLHWPSFGRFVLLRSSGPSQTAATPGHDISAHSTPPVFALCSRGDWSQAELLHASRPTPPARDSNLIRLIEDYLELLPFSTICSCLRHKRVVTDYSRDVRMHHRFGYR